MRLVRLLVRGAGFVLLTALAGLGLVLAAPFALVAPDVQAAVRGFVKRWWGRSVTWLIGFRIEVEGTPPEPPFFLASNHLSYIDVPVLFTLLDATFLAKAEVARWPVMGLLARMAGTQFVDRTRKADVRRANERLVDLLRAGRGVVLFPEGTSTRGEEVVTFKPSLFEPAIRTATPVSCASLSYATPPGSPPADLAVCWWGDMTFFHHFLRLLTLPRIDARVSFGTSVVEATERKELALLAHRGVLANFRPTAAPHVE